MISHKRALILAVSLGLLMGLALPVAAQTGGFEGEVRDAQGKLLPGVEVNIVRQDITATYETKTDDKGHYIYMGLPAAGATYNVRIIKDGQILYELKNIRAQVGEIRRVDINLEKERQLQQQQMSEEQKKQIEAQRKAAQQFTSMKANFDLAMSLMKDPSAAMVCKARCPGETPDPACMSTCQQETGSGNAQQMAYQEAAAALEKASVADPTQMAVWAQLARAYELTGQNEKAVEAYKKALEVKPDETAVYNNLGNLYVKMGDVEAAQKAFTKAAELNPAEAGTYFFNLGVTFYNAGNLAAAVEPLQKSTQIDPNRADAYYLLGVCLYSQAEFKQEGDSWVTILKPGTKESFERYLELEPTGKFAEQAKQNLEAIQATIPATVQVKKKKKS